MRRIAALFTEREQSVGPKLSLRLRLALLVAGTTLPLIIFSAAIVYLNYQAAREAASQRVLEIARSVMLDVDRELHSTMAALQVLALSIALQRDDLAGFRTQAEAFLRLRPPGSTVSLANREGQQIFNVMVPEGEPLPRRINLDTVEAVFATGRPAVSNLFVGATLRRPVVTVDVPVFRQGEVVYDLAYNAPLERFSEILEQRRQEGRIYSVFDRAGVNIARVPNPGRPAGEEAEPSPFVNIHGKSEGLTESTSVEGVPLLTAFSRSPSSGWSVAVGIPRDALARPLWRSLGIAIMVGLVLLCVGLTFAVQMATHIAYAQTHRDLLIQELNHRVKNTLAIVQSIAARTFASSPANAEAKQAFEARLVAYARAHNVLSDEHWESAELREIVAAMLEPYATQDKPRFSVSGPDLRLRPQPALAIAMLLHELTTNAVKYGALSQSGGHVLVTWSIVNSEAGPRFSLLWKETGGPPVTPPQRKGFGSTLIERGFAREFGGTATLLFEPAGVVCTIDIPYAAMK